MKLLKKLVIPLCLLFLCSGVASGCDDSGQSGSQGNGENIFTKKYTVTFNYNDGSGRVETVQIPEGAKIDDYAPSVLEGNREIVAWSTIDNGAHYSAEISSDLNLVGVWKEHEIVSHTDSIPTTLINRFAAIEPESASVVNGKLLKIGANVRSLSLIGDGSIYEDFTIIVAERSENLTVTLDNFSYTSTGECAFNARNEGTNISYTLTLNLVGANGIDSSSAVHATSARGADCLHAHQLEITGTGSLSLVAGNGVNGTNGTPDYGAEGTDGGHAPNNAQAGGVGIVAESINVGACTLSVTGGAGGNGGKGGAGRNKGGSGIFGNSGKQKAGGNGAPGANGGAAIQTNSFIAANTTLHLKGGNGGNGGAGGNAGGVTWTNGGWAGNGANGGNGGSLFAGEIAAQLTKTVNNFTVGVGGNGGAGGIAVNVPERNGTAGQKGADGATNIK